jgi:hypothetical protein
MGPSAPGADAELSVSWRMPPALDIRRVSVALHEKGPKVALRYSEDPSSGYAVAGALGPIVGASAQSVAQALKRVWREAMSATSACAARCDWKGGECTGGASCEFHAMSVMFQAANAVRNYHWPPDTPSEVQEHATLESAARAKVLRLRSLELLQASLARSQSANTPGKTPEESAKAAFAAACVALTPIVLAPELVETRRHSRGTAPLSLDGGTGDAIADKQDALVPGVAQHAAAKGSPARAPPLEQDPDSLVQGRLSDLRRYKRGDVEPLEASLQALKLDFAQ